MIHAPAARAAPRAEAAAVLRDVDEVARGARHRVPLEDRDLRLVAGGAGLDVRARVDEVVAQVQVLDARRVDRRHLVEGLDEVRPAVPDTGVTGCVERADAPVVRVVAEDDRRRQRRRDRQLRAADLGAGSEVDGGVDLDLVLRRARHRVPRELRVEHLVGRHQVGDVGGRRRRPRPVEGAHRRCASPCCPRSRPG